MNKVPRGPLSTDQVRALMKAGLIRHNDVAFQVPEKSEPGTEKQPSEWKLLWQFPDFDRRKDPEAKANKPGKPEYSGTSTPEAAKAAEPERRKEMSPEQAREKARENLPPDMLDIAPEDLVVHSTTHHESVGLPPAAEDIPKGSPPEFNLPSGRILWVLGGILILLVSVGVFRMGGLRPAVPNASTVVEHPTTDRVPGSGKRSLPSARSPSQAPGARITGTGAGPRPVTSRAPEPRLPASSAQEEEHERDRGEVEPREEDEERELDEDGNPRENKSRPTPNRRKARVLSDEEEGGSASEEEPAPPPYSEDD